MSYLISNLDPLSSLMHTEQLSLCPQCSGVIQLFLWKYKGPRKLFFFFNHGRNRRSHLFTTYFLYKSNDEKVYTELWSTFDFYATLVLYLCRVAAAGCRSENNYVFFVHVKKRARSPITVYLHSVSKWEFAFHKISQPYVFFSTIWHLRWCPSQMPRLQM